MLVTILFSLETCHCSGILFILSSVYCSIVSGRYLHQLCTGEVLLLQISRASFLIGMLINCWLINIPSYETVSTALKVKNLPTKPKVLNKKKKSQGGPLKFPPKADTKTSHQWSHYPTVNLLGNTCSNPLNRAVPLSMWYCKLSFPGL